jgi:hypothetical protein
MSQRKKFILMEIIFLFIPITLAWLNVSFASVSKFPWGYDNTNLVTSVAFLLGILANAYVLKKSWRHSFVWTIISLILIVVSSSFLFIGNSLSNFGF